jgi:hypothetical protein
MNPNLVQEIDLPKKENINLVLLKKEYELGCQENWRRNNKSSRSVKNPANQRLKGVLT